MRSNLLIGAGAAFLGYKTVKGVANSVQDFMAKRAEEKRRNAEAQLKKEKVEAEKAALKTPEKIVDLLDGIRGDLHRLLTKDD